MSSTEARLRYPVHNLRRVKQSAPVPASLLTDIPPPPPPPDLQRGGKADAAAPDPAPQAPTPIIPPHSVAGHALLAVIAIMSFLAALTFGAVVVVRTAANDWQGQVSRELTIQIRPTEGRDIEADVAHAAEISRSIPGIAEVKPYSREDSARLLEPWLGSGLSLAELPVPRLIVISAAPGAQPDLDRLRQRLSAELPTATLDDHRAWIDRMRMVTRTAVTTGLGVLALMLTATVLLVAFATRGAMAANRAIVEVLHFVGAKNRYIAGQFQRHFLLVGMKGACLGGGAATLVFLLGPWLAGHLHGADLSEFELLFGGLALGAGGFGGIIGVLALVAAVTAITSRVTVHRTLGAID
ncbi:MAG TPA: ABC transporter permease [Xanthobacteraceae bacterium]|nr:ABC transporter permease [Xanthobacteraceae bacterium]